MEFMGIDVVHKKAKPGDKLQGKFEVYPTGLKSKVAVNELAFLDFIGCLLDNPDMMDGANYYLEKLEDGSFKKYGIIREVNGVLKAPVEWIDYVIDKHHKLLCEQGNSIVDWEEWELQNCYCEDNSKGKTKYTCCFNKYACAYTETFDTLIAVWAYLNTDMDVEHCRDLDRRVRNKETIINALSNIIELDSIIDDYKKENRIGEL